MTNMGLICGFHMVCICSTLRSGERKASTCMTVWICWLGMLLTILVASTCTCCGMKRRMLRNSWMRFLWMSDASVSYIIMRTTWKKRSRRSPSSTGLTRFTNLRSERMISTISGSQALRIWLVERWITWSCRERSSSMRITSLKLKLNRSIFMISMFRQRMRERALTTS